MDYNFLDINKSVDKNLRKFARSAGEIKLQHDELGTTSFFKEIWRY